jgi:succinate-semialdehyde dehydrogenase/glutarate-semialdehyde dehydrogenase
MVFEDSDLDLAVTETIKGKFRNSGQTCVCPNRVYVQSSLAEAYAAKLAEAVAQIPVGPVSRRASRSAPSSRTRRWPRLRIT